MRSQVSCFVFLVSFDVCDFPFYGIRLFRYLLLSTFSKHHLFRLVGVINKQNDMHVVDQAWFCFKT